MSDSSVRPDYFATLDPRSISSVEVLKGDAATAIYGRSASNGVIWISTAASPEDSSEAPDVRQFPEGSLRFRLGGNLELAQVYVEDLLRRRRIPSTRHPDEPLLYVVTEMIREQPAPGSRRVRGTFVRFRLNTDEAHRTCSDAAVSWLRKSRGVNERTWRVEPEDQQPPPPEIVDTIAQRLEDHRPREGCE